MAYLTTGGPERDCGLLEISLYYPQQGDSERRVKMPKKKVPKKVRQLINALLPYQPERLYLFGSWARGEEDELSDLDVVVIKDTSSSFFDRLNEISRFLPAEIGGLDILVYTPEEFETMQREGNAFAEMINEEARLIYDREAET
jgi:predicted nucleotidyltransferase